MRPADTRPLRIAILALDGMWSHDVASILQVFGSSIEGRDVVRSEVTFISTEDVAQLDHGLSVRATPLGHYDAQPDALLLPGFSDPFALSGPPRTPGMDICLAWLRTQSAAGLTMACLGTGTFLPGWAGILDGVSCTTYPPVADAFARQFPEAHLDATRLVARNLQPDIWSCAGGSSGLDLCLGLAANLRGLAAARGIESTMGLAPAQPPGTLQHASRPRLSTDTQDELGGVRGLVAQDLSRPWTVRSMAEVAHVSPRTLQRAFLRDTGQTPRDWLLARRLSAASELLELTELPVTVIASRVGMGGADVLRRHFAASFGVSPTTYRRRFQSRAS